MMDLGASMHPPAYDSDDDATPRPGFCLLEKSAYFDGRQNATTAVCDLEKGTLQVTFCTVRPPRASYFCFHATAYRPAKFGTEPEILAMEGPLALFRVILGGRRKSFYAPGDGEFFVYYADNLSEKRPPSLKHIPHPTPYRFIDSAAAIMRHCPRRASTQRVTRRAAEDHNCGDCNYVIAALNSAPRTTDYYELLLYHSKTANWSGPAQALRRSKDWPISSGGATCKAISIGGEGGTVAWTDLDYDRGIIFCDVLAITDVPVVRGLNLPPPIKSIKDKELSGYFRDIAFIDGSMVYTELQIHTPYINEPRGEYEWKATTWKNTVRSWHMECSFDSSGISKSLRRQLCILAADTIFYTGLPSLSLQDDGIVYMPTKTDFQDAKSWVLAVDMKHNNVREVVEFGTQRDVPLGRDFFIPSRISKYLLQVTPGASSFRLEVLQKRLELGCP